MFLPGLAALAVHAGVVPPDLWLCVMLVAIAQCVVRILVVAVAGSIAMVTKDPARRTACLQLVEIVWRNWAWPLRPTGPRA
jgi:hypothetical protein